MLGAEIALGSLHNLIAPHLDELKDLHNQARVYATDFDGAMYGYWPVEEWFIGDQVEVSSVRSSFKALNPMYADCYFYRGYAILEAGTDSGLKIYQPFMPPHPETTYPALEVINLPNYDWLAPRLATLVSRVKKLTSDLEKNGRVLHARRLDLYRGSRKK